MVIGDNHKSQIFTNLHKSSQIITNHKSYNEEILFDCDFFGDQ